MKISLPFFTAIISLICCFAASHLAAQKEGVLKIGIKGTLIDTSGKDPLHYAVVALISKKDSALVASSRSLPDGSFGIDKVMAGNYTVLITFPHMADFIMDVSLRDTGLLNLGKVVMTSRFHLLQEVIVQSGKAIRMKGDTLEFRADSFPVGQGANVEELLRRLPGIEVGPDGKIKAQGENVTRVLVDGDEFFNDDPTLATKYLKATSVDKVQVFDRKSDQAVFTGIDDGIRNKTINIKLKENSRNGLFGKVSAGADGKRFYNDEGMLNLFRGREKVSVFGIGSNTGTTGLSSADRSQYLSSAFDGIEDETGRLIGGGLDNSDRYYGSGLPSSIYAGTQYANKWNAGKQNVNVNYRLNQLRTAGWQTGSNSQLLPDSSVRQSISNSTSSSYSIQHKGGGYYEMALDSFSTVKVSVQAQAQKSSSENESYSESTNGAGKYLNKSTQLNMTAGTNNLFTSSVQWQHRFRKLGRNTTLTLMQNDNDNRSTRHTDALSYYFTAQPFNPPGDSLNQEQLNRYHTSSVAARITYTEPLLKSLYLSTEYSWRTTNTDKDREVMKRGATGKYDIPVDSLSNNYTYKVITHMPGVTLQFNSRKFTLSAGGKLGYTTLEQINRNNQGVYSRQFINLFPHAQVNFNKSQFIHIYLNYSGRTDQPSIDQLQPLRENSNPLYVTIGNPGLQPSFSHQLNMSYSMFAVTGTSINVSVNWSQTLNAITGTQTIDQFNKTTYQFINRNGLPGFGMYASINRRLGKLTAKSSLNIGLNLNVNQYGYNRIVNNTDIISHQLSFSGGPRISFYRTKVFNLNYNSSFSYNQTTSDVANIGSTYNWGHNHSAGTTVFLPGKMEFVSDVNMNFQPANSYFRTARQIIKWNASLVKKFGQNGQAEVKLAVFDILNQNTGYYRYASGGSYSESSTNYIPRYALLSFTWNFTRTL